MKKLPPLVDGVDGKHLKLRALDGVDFDFMGYMLCCHLVIEHHLDEFLATLGTDLHWNDARLTFAQKALLFPPEIFPHGPELISAIKHLNSLRNKMAHNIRSRPQQLNFEPLQAFLKRIYKQRDKIPSDPHEILEAFTSAVCSFLIGWIASDACRTTWRQKRQAQQGIHADGPLSGGSAV